MAWSALTSALTTTWALPAPSVWASRAVAAAAVLASYWLSTACLEVEPPEPLADVGHSSWPVPSVIVTLPSCRPGTLEATRFAMPRTALGSRLPESDRRTEAVAGWLLSANSWACGLGRTRLTWAESTPWICSIVVSS